MKSKKVFIFCCIMILAGGLLAHLNRSSIYDLYVQTTFPETKEYLGIDWQPTTDTANAAYYRLIHYNSNAEPVGMVRDYYANGQIQWEGHILSVKPFVKDGTCTKWYKTGQKQSEINYMAGKKEGIANYYADNGTLLPSQYFEDDTVQIAGYFLEKLLRQSNRTKVLQAGGYVLEGNYFSGKGQLNTAIEKYNQALAILPDYVYAKTQLADSYFTQGHYDNAIIQWQLLQDLHPEPYKVLYYLGMTYENKGHLPDAIDYYLRATQAQDGSTASRNITGDAFAQIGDIYTNSEQPNEAAKFYTKAINTVPTESYFYSDRAWAYLATDIDTLRNLAFEDIETSLELNAQNEDAYMCRAILKTYSNDLNGAWDDIVFAKKLAPRNEQITGLYDNIYQLRNPPSYAYHNSGSTSGISALDLITYGFIAYEIYDIGRDLYNGDIWKATKQVARDVIVGAAANAVVDFLSGN